MSSDTRPFLKWPGGKYRLLTHLLPHLPQRKTLIEPFCGGSALFINTLFPRAYLNDIHVDLMNVYQQLKHRGHAFIREAQTFFVPHNNRESIYYQLRHQFNHSHDLCERALLFLYLNRHGYNGLCRYNLKGHYNVPFGAYQAPYFPKRELECYRVRLQKTFLSCEPYDRFLKRFLRRKHLQDYVIYCDPPYVPLSKTASFTNYGPAPFTEAHQKHLSLLAEQLTQRGAYVLITNHDTPLTRRLYHRAKVIPFLARRSISCKIRYPAPELLACYHP